MIHFMYKNYKGEIKERRVKPLSLHYYPVPNPKFGYQPGWFLHCEDYTGDRQGVIRSFALSNIQLPEKLFEQPRNDRPFCLTIVDTEM